MKFKPAFLMAICLSGCATAELYRDHSHREDRVRHLIEGEEVLARNGDRYYLRHGADYYEIADNTDTIRRADTLVIWVDGPDRIPSSCQFNRRDAYLGSASILPPVREAHPDGELRLHGVVASFEAYEIKDESLLRKAALTPFALAVDAVVAGAFMALGAAERAPYTLASGGSITVH